MTCQGVAEFAFLCMALRPNPDVPVLAERAQRGLDWQKVLQGAVQHQVASQLYPVVRRLDREAVPEPVMTRLAQAAQFTAIRSQRLVPELFRLLKLFKAQSIAAVPFKGPVLSWLAYGDLGRRFFSDLDIYVPREQIQAAHDLLNKDGYHNQRPDRSFAQEFRQRLTSRYLYDEWYWKTLDQRDLFGARVELHWPTAMTHAIHPIDPEGCWARRIPLPLGDAVYSFAPDDLFLLLCTNFSKDHWRYLRMVLDIVALWQRQEIGNWAEILERAEQWGRRRAVLLAFALARDCLAVDPPQEIAEWMAKDSVLASLAHSVQQRLILQAGTEPSPRQKLIYNFRLREGLGRRWRYTLASIDKLREGY